jgi:malate/lactate dehydrogenase
MKILIIGIGRIGSYLAYYLLNTDTSLKLFLYGHDPIKAEGLLHDLKEAFPNAQINAVKDISDIEPVELTIMTFSTLKWFPQLNVNDRLIEGVNNLRILDSISRDVPSESLGTILIISNPVDILTWHATIKFNTQNVFGFGISLDEKRMAAVVSQKFGGDYLRVQCVGEHGHNIVPILSMISEIENCSSILYDELKNEMFIHTSKIIKNVSIPLFGPLRELERLLPFFIGKSNGTISVSKYIDKPYMGISDLALGLPVQLQKGKFIGFKKLGLNNVEYALFQKAANQIKNTYLSLINQV